MEWMKTNMLSWPDLVLVCPFSLKILSMFLPALCFDYCQCFSISVWTFLSFLPRLSAISFPFFSTSLLALAPSNLHTNTYFLLYISAHYPTFPNFLTCHFFSKPLPDLLCASVYCLSLHSSAPVQPDSSLHPSLSDSCLSPLLSSISPAPLFMSSELLLLSTLLRVMATKFLLDPLHQRNTHILLWNVNTWGNRFSCDVHVTLFYLPKFVMLATDV